MSAKSFFYVSLGILALAAAYHLGASNARAQSGGAITMPSCDGPVAGVVGRSLYYLNGNTGSTGVLHDPIPGTSPIIATGCDSAHLQVLLENGDVYGWNGTADAPGGYWTYYGNLVGGATPATRESWGAVKAAHR